MCPRTRRWVLSPFEESKNPFHIVRLAFHYGSVARLLSSVYTSCHPIGVPVEKAASIPNANQ